MPTSAAPCWRLDSARPAGIARRTMPLEFSMMPVVHQHCISVGVKPWAMTVKVSRRPSSNKAGASVPAWNFVRDAIVEVQWQEQRLPGVKNFEAAASAAS
mgnify:CR=1 FL=1